MLSAKIGVSSFKVAYRSLEHICQAYIDKNTMLTPRYVQKYIKNTTNKYVYNMDIFMQKYWIIFFSFTILYQKIIFIPTAKTHIKYLTLKCTAEIFWALNQLR